MVKGSPEAFAWAKKMKKARIRAAGKRTEQQFFGPGGEFEDEAAAKRRQNPDRPHGKFLSCVKQVSRQRPKVKDPKAVCGAALNPITLNGNPPNHIRATVQGILYNNVVEVRAEKTGGPHKGLWYHVFRGGSQVQMLALDTGDILLHSKAGKKLWRED